MTNTPLRAALYQRTSKKDQHPENQLPAMRRLAEAREWTVAMVETDKMSGAKESRPGLDRIMQAVRSGEVDVVVTWKLDRLGRSLRHLLRIVDEWKAKGVGFTSASEPMIDTTTPGPMSDLMLALIGAFAEYERSIISERTMLGLERAKAEGKRPGRKPRDFDVERARAMLAEGRSERQVSIALKVPRRTLRRRLGRHPQA